MPDARQVLDLLRREELLPLIDQHAVPVTSRAGKAHLIEQLDAQGPGLAALLAGFSRDRLKELCRALGLDDSGREKAAIIARITGAATPTPPTPTVARANGKANGKPAEPIEIAAAGKLTIQLPQPRGGRPLAGSADGPRWHQRGRQEQCRRRAPVRERRGP